MAKTAVPDRGRHPKRKVNFYDAKGNLSHSADVRMVTRLRHGGSQTRPHEGDIKRNTKNLGPYHAWEVQQ